MTDFGLQLNFSIDSDWLDCTSRYINAEQCLKISTSLTLFCRNPLSYRADDANPWCLTQDPSVRWQSCDVPRCPTNLGVVLNTANSFWTVSGGLEFLPFVCETDSECVEDNGFFYNGLVQTSWTGKACQNWREHETRVNNTM